MTRARLSALAWPLIAAVVGLIVSPAGSQQPRRGGSVTIALYQEPELLNPLIASQTAAFEVSIMTVEGLLRNGPDGRPIPQLAAEVPDQKNGGVSADGKTITYHLKPSVVWSDGQPMTCDDVKFTWQVLTTPKSGAIYTSGYDQIQAVDCPAPQTVVVRYKQLYAPFLSRFGAILPRHATGDPAEMTKWAYNRKPVGTGPFMVTEWASGDHITLVRNPRYRVKDQPYLDRVIVRIVPSREVGKQVIKTGDVDVVWDLIESDVPELKGASGVKISSAPGPSAERLVVNLADPSLDGPSPDIVGQHPHPILGDPRVREAIELGINKREITSKLLYGLASVGTNELHIGWAECDTPTSSYNPPRARALLQEAGWAPGPDGIRVARNARYATDGTRLRLKIQTTTGNKLREEAEQLIIQYMRAIGLEFYIENVPSPVLFGSWASGAFRKHGHFDVVMYTTNPDVDPQSQVEGYFASWKMPTAQNGGDGFNYARYASPQVDADVKKAASSTDLTIRRAAYCEAMHQIVADRPHIYLYNRASLSAYRDRLQGWVTNVWENLPWNAQAWWVTR
ncbi:MAG TPA: peptide ABC transporter substrate-binding protein [bacterium]|nr:peptide ABC transporter substrate-binding protein [bacterium]